MGANQSISPSRPPSFNEVPRHVITSFYPRLDVPEDTVYKSESIVQGGVGIVFVKAPCVDDQYVADIYVNLLVKGGPAHMSGRIMQGDILRFVDDYDLRHHPTFAFPPLSGASGSQIVLGFERGFGQPPFFVSLTRSFEYFPDQLALPPPGFEFPSRSMRHQPEPQSMRHQPEPQSETAALDAGGKSGLSSGRMRGRMGEAEAGSGRVSEEGQRKRRELLRAQLSASAHAMGEMQM